MGNPFALLRRAAALYDDPGSPFAAAARDSHDFLTGARWMHMVLSRLRGAPLPPMCGPLQRAGIFKYALACLAALAPVAVGFLFKQPLWAIFAVPCFYAAEVQMLFLFPLMLDHHPRPWRQSLRLTQRAGGTLSAMATVLPLAATMLAGGWLGRGFRRSWCLGCLAVCLWYEEIRRPSPLIREESCDRYQLQSPVRLLYASDLHLGRRWTRRAAVELLESVRRARPDLILLGGDLLDTASGLELLERVIARLTSRCPVYVTPGNHDRLMARLEQTVRGGGAHWLPETPSLFRTRVGDVLTIASGRIAAGDRQIHCLHDPADASPSVPLSFAGHLHGGQCVLATRGGRLYPGYFFNRLTALRRVTAGATLLVSRGLADTLPLRFNCPHEVILCTLT